MQMTRQREDVWNPLGPDIPVSGRFGLWGPVRLTLYRVTTGRWHGPALRIAVIADPHVCLPWASPARLSGIVAQTNSVGADLIVIAGDLLADRNLPCHLVPAHRIAPLLRPLSAPLGVFAIMGNHDWKDCDRAVQSGGTDSSVRDAYAVAGIPLLIDESRRLFHRGHEFHLVGLDSSIGKLTRRGRDAERAFAEVPEGADAILLAHEPDYFALGDERPCLQISGHTHGGQFTLFGRRPMTPSAHGDRYALGHIREGGRDLVVSAGLGYSGLPFRLGVPPELTLIELRAV
jgi:predicted MPP superfamily phosphohydrolase